MQNSSASTWGQTLDAGHPPWEQHTWCQPPARPSGARALPVDHRTAGPFIRGLLVEDAASLERLVQFVVDETRSFLGVTVHYIDEESLERRSAALECQRLSGHHTYDAIATVLHAVFVEYKNLHKICVVITENGSNFVKAFR
ncbi:hypothetical protein MRX96_018596 [Rhipicephalus microplus]